MKLDKDNMIFVSPYVGEERMTLIRKILKVEDIIDDNIVVLDKQQFNKIIDDTKLKLIKWEKEKKMHEFIREPKHIESALEHCTNIQQYVSDQAILDSITFKMNLGVSKEEAEAGAEWDGWFTLKLMVEATDGLTYSKAQELLDTLFAFGFVIRDDSDRKFTKFRIIATPENRIMYLEDCRREMECELGDLEDMIEEVKKQKRELEKKSAAEKDKKDKEAEKKAKEDNKKSNKKADIGKKVVKAKKLKSKSVKKDSGSKKKPTKKQVKQ